MSKVAPDLGIRAGQRRLCASGAMQGIAGHAATLLGVGVARLRPSDTEGPQR